MKRFCFLALGLAAAACSSTPSSTTDAGTPTTGMDAGPVDAGPSWSAPVAVDSDMGAGLDLTSAVDPSGHAAVAYFTKTAPARYTLKLARDNGSGSWSTETVQADLTGHYGVALAFDPQGNPAVAFLGGESSDVEGDGRWHSFETGEPLPSDAVVMRKGASGWTATTIAKLSNDIVATGFPVDDKGTVIGLWGALAFDAAGALHAAFRDIHYGNDDSATAVSNLEYYQGSAGGSKTAGELIAGGQGDAMHLSGAGTYTKMLIVNGQPVVSFALAPGSTDDAQQIWFAQRSGPATWSKVMLSGATGQIGSGPSLAYSAGGGFTVAAYDADQGDLVTFNSKDGAMWTTNTLEALGDTGRHPSAAYDAQGQLGVLYAYCRAPTEPADGCSSSKELRFRLGSGDAERIAGVMPDATALVLDGSGKFQALYRDPAGGVLVSVRTP